MSAKPSVKDRGCFARDLEQVEAGMVRQQEDAERPIEIATDIRVEPNPFTFVFGEAHAVFSSHVPAKSVTRRSAIFGSAAGEDLPQVVGPRPRAWLLGREGGW